MAGLLGHAGCLTAAILILAVSAGLWVDGSLGSRPWATLALMAVSLPVNAFLIFRIVRSGATRLGLRPGTDSGERDPQRGG